MRREKRGTNKSGKEGKEEETAKTTAERRSDFVATFKLVHSHL